MSEDATPYNPLTPQTSLSTILPIDTVLAQKICVAVAQVLHAGFGKVELTITHHQVQVIQTTFTDKLNV